MARGPKIDWYKLGISFSRLMMGCFLIYLGIVTVTDSGERTYNKYLHAIRKMLLPNSKPGDFFVPGLTMDQLNKYLIQVEGILVVLSGLLVLMNKNCSAAVIMILFGVFMMASKDNIKIESTVAVIGREKPMRPENFTRDLSFIGAAIVLLGGLGSQGLTEIYQDPVDNKVKDE